MKHSFIRFKLHLEVLAIPKAAEIIESMKIAQRELVEGLGAPVFTVWQMQKPIRWVYPEGATTAQNLGIDMKPWLALPDDSYPVPTDACLRRFNHHIRCEGLRGIRFTAKDIQAYIAKWPERIKDEKAFGRPDLILPRPVDVMVHTSPQTLMAGNEHSRLEKGELHINDHIKMKVTDTSKHHTTAPFSKEVDRNLKHVFPVEATPQDRKVAQLMIRSNLATSTRKSMQTAEKTLRALIPKRDVFKRPRKGDKGLLLVKLMNQRSDLSDATKLGYIKFYGSILHDKGLQPPLDCPLYTRISTGLRKRMHDPRRKEENIKREAYSIESLKAAAHAIAKMASLPHKPWDALRVQAVYTAMVIAFWACARTRDLCGAGKNTYSTRTTLCEQDLTLMQEGDQVIGLEIHFKAEKVAKAMGSRVQLPRVKGGPLERLCPVLAYQRYQRLKSNFNQRPQAPWLIDNTGKPIQQHNLLRLINTAIDRVFGDTHHKEYLQKLKGHSFRMALPTHMQEMAATLTKAERKMMGRWASDEAYQRYCKDLKGPRYNTAKKVISHLKRAHSAP